MIFENAVNKNASLPPPRAQTTDMANARNIQQFNELKNKGNVSRGLLISGQEKSNVLKNLSDEGYDLIIK